MKIHLASRAPLAQKAKALLFLYLHRVYQGRLQGAFGRLLLHTHQDPIISISPIEQQPLVDVSLKTDEKIILQGVAKNLNFDRKELLKNLLVSIFNVLIQEYMKKTFQKIVFFGKRQVFLRQVVFEKAVPRILPKYFNRWKYEGKIHKCVNNINRKINLVHKFERLLKAKQYKAQQHVVDQIKQFAQEMFKWQRSELVQLIYEKLTVKIKQKYFQ